MRDSDRRRRINDTVEELAFVLGRLDDLMDNLDEYDGTGYPARSQMISDIHQGRGTQNPTEAIVERQLEKPDTIRADRRKIDKLINHGLNTARELRRLAATYTNTRTNPTTEPGCRLCDKGGRWRKIYAQERCRFHYDKWRELGEDLDHRLTKLHLDGQRITPTMISRYHPNATRVSTT